MMDVLTAKEVFDYLSSESIDDKAELKGRLGRGSQLFYIDCFIRVQATFPALELSQEPRLPFYKSCLDFKEELTCFLEYEPEHGVNTVFHLEMCHIYPDGSHDNRYFPVTSIYLENSFLVLESTANESLNYREHFERDDDE